MRSFGESRIFTAAEIVAEELPPVRWVVPDLLPEGVTLLAGKQKLGKSGSHWGWPLLWRPVALRWARSPLSMAKFCTSPWRTTGGDSKGV